MPLSPSTASLGMVGASHVARALAVALVGLSGCLEAPPSAGSVDEAGEAAPRRSVGGAGGGNTTPTRSVDLLDEPIAIVGDDVLEFTVVVPANATLAEATHAPEANTLSLSFHVELTGCGREGYTGLNGGNVARTFTLCAEASPGRQTVRLDNQGGVVDGRLRVTVRVPAEASA